MATSDLYCSRADVTKRLPLGSVQSPAGITATCLASTNALTLDGHGLETGDQVTVRTADDGSLPTPLALDTIYFAIRVTNGAFRLSTTNGGAAIDLTTDGTSVVVSREPNFDDTIEYYSRWADTFMPAHAVPFKTVPVVVRGLVADLAAKRILNANGQDSGVVNAAELAAKAQLERFATGIPIREATNARTNKALSRTLGVSVDSVDPRGWGSRGIP